MGTGGEPEAKGAVCRQSPRVQSQTGGALGDKGAAQPPLGHSTRVERESGGLGHINYGFTACGI